MYDFYTISKCRIDREDDNDWIVITLEGGSSPIVEGFLSEGDATDIKALRLSEGAGRMVRYCEDGQSVIATELLNSDFIF